MNAFRDAGGYRHAPFPAGGAWRVHPAPEVLPTLSREGPGRNRYDDPLAQYTVRYLAARLSGALVETMARFRPSPDAEALLAGVTGAQPQPGEAADPDPVDGVAVWLASQRVARVSLPVPRPLLDVHDPALLVALDKHPLVRAALDASQLGTSHSPARLDEGVVRIGGPIGRPVTQAVSRAVYEWLPDAAGLAYRSRLDDAEPCWAVWDHIPVTVTSTPLSRADPAHAGAVRAVASLLELPLPASWS